jgi:LacI family transcriptional regulator
LPSRPTIPDVAREAGVSVPAAGRALGGYGYVSQDMRQRVLAAAERLGYRRNSLARSMVTGRTHTIGFVGSDIENSFFARAMRGISDAAHAHEYQVILTNSDEDPNQERASVQLLLEKRVDGIIVAPADPDHAEHLEAAIRDGTPVVLLDRDIDSLAADSVVVDNVVGAETAVAHLIELGHQRIAVIGTRRGPMPVFGAGTFQAEAAAAVDPQLLRPGAARVLGYLRAHAAAGLTVQPELVRIGAEPQLPRAGLQRRVVALAETSAVLQVDDPPTAIFTTDSDMSHGAIQAIREAGLRVPLQVSVVGFDDLDWATLLEPPLSVVEQPAYELGNAAVERLVARIEGDERPPRRIVLSTRLLLRASTAPPEIS